MTARIRRGRRHIRCTACGKDTRTRHPDTTLCAKCRDRVRPHTTMNLKVFPS